MPTPYEHYAKNDETGEYVGWDGTQWVPVHPREVPGTVANTAAARQPQMRAAERNLRKAADGPSFGDRLQSVGSGLWDVTGASVSGMGNQQLDFAKRHPVASTMFPPFPVMAPLIEGMVGGVKSRAADLKTSVDKGDYLRATGDAIAIGTAPVGGTAFADTADMILEDPDRALGQALGIGATFVAPVALKAGARASGPLGRSMQRAGAERGALAMNPKRLPDLEKLVEIDDAGRPQGPIVNILDSPEGLPTAMTQKGLRQKLTARGKIAGQAVGDTKAAIQPNQYVFDRAMVDNVLLKSIDDEIVRRTNTVGGQPTARPDGRPLGRTTADTTAIDNLSAAKQDILTSLDPTTGKLDLADLFGKIDTWDDVYESSRVQAGGKLDITSRAFTDKMAADAIRRTLAKQIPDLARVNREFSSLRTATDVLEANLKVVDPWLGPRGKRFIAAYLPLATAAGFANAPLGFAVAGAAAGAETIGAILTSTPMRTWSANRLYQFGKFLEAGDLQAATQTAQAAAAEAQAVAPEVPNLPDPPEGTGGAAGRPTTPPPTAGTSGATPSGAGGGPASTPALPIARRMPEPPPALVEPATPAASTPAATPPLDPYAEVVDLFNKRNAFVADEAGRAIDAGNANVVLKEAAAARAAATPAAAPPPATAKAVDKTKTAPTPKRLPARPEDILEPPARGAIIPKQAPKPTTTATAATPAKPVDYSSMDAAGLQTQLRNAERHRDSLRKMSAGSNAFRDAQRRVDDIQRAIVAKQGTSPTDTAAPSSGGGDRERRPGVQVEWPKDPNGRDENADYFLKRPPSLELPERFKSARKVTYGTPVTKDIRRQSSGQPDPNLQGVFGRKFDPRPGPLPRNTALISAGARDEAATYAHETFHSAYKFDLTPAERAEFKRTMDPIFSAHSKEFARLMYPLSGRATLTPPDAAAKAADNLRLPRVAVYGQMYNNPQDPEAKYDEAFSELGAQYMLNPTAFKKTHPKLYGWFQKLIGREYIEVDRTPRQPTGQVPQQPRHQPGKPKRFTADRRGQRIEGVHVRSFDTANGRAMILRADDGSERFVFESEIQPS